MKKKEKIVRFAVERRVRLFTRAYTAEELDRGEGMTFFPCDRRYKDGGAIPLAYPPFIYRDGRFYQYGYSSLVYVRLSEGKDVQAGDPYPEHWVTDPWTGELLVVFKAYPKQLSEMEA